MLKWMVALLCVVASVPLSGWAQGNAAARSGWLGLQAQDPESGDEAQGVTIIDILPGSPADSAGLRIGDRIGAINGRAIGSRADLGRVVSGRPPGTALKLSVHRGNRTVEVTVKLGEPPGSLPTNGARAKPATPAPAPSRSRDRSSRKSSTRAPAPVNPYEDDDQSSDSANCAQVCRRAAECNVMQFERCSKMCNGAAKDGHTWRLGQSTCAEIRNGFVNDKWMCTAEASAGSAVGNMPYIYRNVSMPGTGSTREEAARDALKECSAMVSYYNHLAWLDGAAVQSGSCEVTRCDPPGTPL